MDPNWKKPEVSPEMVSLVNDIEVPKSSDDGVDTVLDGNGNIRKLKKNRFGGLYASNLLELDSSELQPITDKLLKAWHKAYESYIPKYDKSKLKDQDNDAFETAYARSKDIVDRLGPIRIFDDKSLGLTFSNFACKYIDANENPESKTYRFKMLNPIYDKIGNWWVGDKGQPIMSATGISSVDDVPKSYDDYLKYPDSVQVKIDKLTNGTANDFEKYSFTEDLYVNDFDALDELIPGMQSYKSVLNWGEDSTRMRTPLEFMPGYDPDVLVPEAKLNEIAKEHPEVWKPMILDDHGKGYKSICVSTNGYIISAYQPAPNVFLPIHIYGVSDHRGPNGYDAAKSVIITINNYNAGPNGTYTVSGKGDVVDSVFVNKAYENMLTQSRQI